METGYRVQVAGDRVAISVRRSYCRSDSGSEMFTEVMDWLSPGYPILSQRL
jgi:hypothetical protein